MTRRAKKKNTVMINATPQVMFMYEREQTLHHFITASFTRRHGLHHASLRHIEYDYE